MKARILIPWLIDIPEKYEVAIIRITPASKHANKYLTEKMNLKKGGRCAIKNDLLIEYDPELRDNKMMVSVLVGQKGWHVHNYDSLTRVRLNCTAKSHHETLKLQWTKSTRFFSDLQVAFYDDDRVDPHPGWASTPESKMNIFEKSKVAQTDPRLNPVIVTLTCLEPSQNTDMERVALQVGPSTKKEDEAEQISPIAAAVAVAATAVATDVGIVAGPTIEECQFDYTDQSGLVAIFDDWKTRKRTEQNTDKTFEKRQTVMEGVDAHTFHTPIEEKLIPVEFLVGAPKKRVFCENRAVIIALNYDGPQISQTLGKYETVGKYVTPVPKVNPKYKKASNEAKFLGKRVIPNSRENGDIWYAFIKEKYKFKDEQILLFQDSELSMDKHGRPDKQGILQALTWLIDGAIPGDNLFFYFCGHGNFGPTPVRNKKPKSKRELVEPVEVNTGLTSRNLLGLDGSTISDLDIYNQIYGESGKDLADGVNLTMIVESTNDMSGMGLQHEVNFADLDKKDFNWSTVNELYNQTNTIALCSQLSKKDLINSNTKDKFRGTAFTKSFHRVITEVARMDIPVRYEVLLRMLNTDAGLKVCPSLHSSQIFDLKHDFNIIGKPHRLKIDQFVSPYLSEAEQNEVIQAMKQLVEYRKSPETKSYEPSIEIGQDIYGNKSNLNLAEINKFSLIGLVDSRMRKEQHFGTYWP